MPQKCEKKKMNPEINLAPWIRTAEDNTLLSVPGTCSDPVMVNSVNVTPAPEIWLVNFSMYVSTKTAGNLVRQRPSTWSTVKPQEKRKQQGTYSCR